MDIYQVLIRVFMFVWVSACACLCARMLCGAIFNLLLWYSSGSMRSTAWQRRASGCDMTPIDSLGMRDVFLCELCVCVIVCECGFDFCVYVFMCTQKCTYPLPTPHSPAHITRTHRIPMPTPHSECETQIAQLRALREQRELEGEVFLSHSTLCSHTFA